MLFETVIRRAKQAGFVGQNKGVVERIRNSGRFVLDDTSSRAMTQLALMKPSRIMMAKEFLQLPFDSIWIEYLDTARKEVYDEQGMESQTYNNRAFPSRVGNLVWKDINDPGRVYIWSAWSFSNGNAHFSWTPLAMRFDLTFTSASEKLKQDWYDTLLDQRSEFKPSDGLLYVNRNSETELRAIAEMNAVCDIHICPGLERTPAAQEFLHHKSNPNVAQKLEASTIDLVREAGYVMASLLLLNCRSGTSHEEVEPRDEQASKLIRVNKHKKASKQKYTIVRMRVPKGPMGTGSTSQKTRAAHWVMGHPKVRKSGVFWWSPHIRGEGTAPASPRTRLVKP